MTQDVVIAGYQGPRSILTGGLTAFAEASLPSATLIPDVTAQSASAQSLFDGIETGTYAAGYMASGYLTSRVPELGVLDLPFSVSDRDRAHSRLDGEAGERLAEAVSRTTNLTVLAFWDNGFRHVTNGVRPIRSPDDCRGLKVRTLNNQLYQDTMAAIGFDPVVTDVKELIEACKTGRVDAQENPLTNMLTFGLDQWHGHVSLTSHIFGVVLLVANKDWFRALGDSDRTLVFEGAHKSAVLQRSLAAEEDSSGLALLAERGVSVLGPDQIDLEAFRLATDSVRNRSAAAIPTDLLRKYLH
ncbi:MAG: TRAP transporter substrate-binding protein DctP [Pseudomonadota bacterium]